MLEVNKVPNGQPKAPENWKDIEKGLAKAVKTTKINLVLLEAQLKVAKEHAR